MKRKNLRTLRENVNIMAYQTIHMIKRKKRKYLHYNSLRNWRSQRSKYREDTVRSKYQQVMIIRPTKPTTMLQLFISFIYDYF